MTHQGICCGTPLPDSRICEAQERGFNLFRANAASATQASFDQFAKFNAEALWVLGVYGTDAASVRRTLDEAGKLPGGSLVELGNELNIGDAPAGMPRMTPDQYATVVNETRTWLEAMGHTVWYGCPSNINRDGQEWLRRFLQLCPWVERVSVHRYPYKGDQDPSRSPYGSRSAEMSALRSVLGDRRVLVTETGIMCGPRIYSTGWWPKKWHDITEQQQLDYLKQEVGYWQDYGTCDGVCVWVEIGRDGETYRLRDDASMGTDERWRLAGDQLFRPPVAQFRAVAFVVENEKHERIAGASCYIQVSASGWLSGPTDAEGVCTWPEVAGTLANTQVRVRAEGCVPADVSVVLPTNQDVQVRFGAPYDPGQPNAVLLPAMKSTGPTGDIDDVKCDFCSMTFDDGTPIFQNMYPSWPPEKRAEARAKAKANGDTHFQIGNPTTNSDYHHDGVDWLLSDRMDEWVAALRELLADGFFPIVFTHSGDFPAFWQREHYYRDFVNAVPAELRGLCHWLVGHECIPQAAWTTKDYCDANFELRDALGPGPRMGMHGGDGRLSFSSNPVEPDDPFHGDEMACYRGTYNGRNVGECFSHIYYQSANLRMGENLDPEVEGSIAERAKETVTRIDGSAWHGAPDWFAGLSYRPIPVLWEQSEEWFYRGTVTRDWMLQCWAAFKAMGYRGYGCGQ